MLSILSKRLLYQLTKSALFLEVRIMSGLKKTSQTKTSKIEISYYQPASLALCWSWTPWCLRSRSLGRPCSGWRWGRTGSSWRWRHKAPPDPWPGRWQLPCQPQNNLSLAGHHQRSPGLLSLRGYPYRPPHRCRCESSSCKKKENCINIPSFYSSSTTKRNCRLVRFISK